MKRVNIVIALTLCAGIILSGCGASNTVKGTGIGAGIGAAVGAGIGALAGKGKGAAIGAVVGTAVGAGAGALIGNKMDKQKAELERLEGAQVEDYTDVNGLQAIKVTFDSGILFATNKSDLNAASKSSLMSFATSLKNTQETDVTIYGHTDSSGGDNINIPLSEQRALSVQNYLVSQGVSTYRLMSIGMGSSEPVADNATAAGKAQNRRVEIYITANATMIQQAEDGTLK